MDKTAQPPPYSETRPGFTPASYYQGPPPQQLNPSHPPLYPPMSQPQPYQSSPGQPTIIVQTTAAPTMVVLGNGPTHMICPSCRADIVTTVQHTPNFRTHCWAALLCLFVCWPCVCVPYCMDSCQSAHHICPNCNAQIGIYDY
uniref:LITAF domain-containing protein n=1 Tax=Glossina morsitans morsitans TaxID=37546 RepID=A0A1B0FLU0_GLOMM